MFSPLTIILVITLYILFLFLIAMWVERQSDEKKKRINNSAVYSLSLAIYCTSWTYYGSVGKAATSGMLFLTIYLGPTLMIILWGSVLRKLVRIKDMHRITSIADFIAARYGKSQLLAAIVTVIALVGIAPYIALQLKAVISTFSIITTDDALLKPGITSNHLGHLVVLFMIAFTIIFGVRRLDPTERHQGMVVAVAIKSFIKLATFLIAGIFVTYFLFDGFGDIFQKISVSPYASNLSSRFSGAAVKSHGTSFFTWITYLLLSMSAILFLPRQFHIAVVENSDERHIKTAMWLFPLYMFLINIFVLPIAMGGLLKGFSIWDADNFVLLLPLHYGSKWLTLLIFIGGFSAAASMIMITSMTMATMTVNHLLLPLLESLGWIKLLRHHLLKIRWVTVATVIIMGYWFEKQIGDSYTLVNMGMISFAAAIQFSPAILGGIFWQKGNCGGAVTGLVSGFIIWFYCLLLPSFIKSGWINADMLECRNTRWGWLNPERLFCLQGLDTLSHAVFWSMFFNISFYVLGSLYFEQSEEEKKDAEAFVNIFSPHASFEKSLHGSPHILLSEKKILIENLLRQYFNRKNASEIVEKCIDINGLKENKHISVTDLARICSEVEKLLGGSVGTALAHKSFRYSSIFTPEETEELSGIYGEILADLRLTPDELKERIDYYQERGRLISAHAEELEEKLKELQNEIRRRESAEEKVFRLVEELEQRVAERTTELEAANKELESFAYSVSHDLRAPLRSLDGFSQALLEDYLDSFDDQGKDYLKRIRAASQRMGQLIDDMLKLSRINRSEIRRKPTNLSRIVSEIAENLQNTEPQRPVEFVIAPNLIAESDSRLIKIALENLLGNAWKFTGRNSQGCIEFGVMKSCQAGLFHNGSTQNKRIYFIRDNGAGFDMAYLDKLFGAFQRLHTEDEFPGTGVGLATVQRIIHRHGGNVWAEGIPDKGATFYFTLSDRRS